ncbi:hypothetical protein SK128_007875 [Halocaridina rubra]|uniref:Lipocalin/cytosolic fatty-acid binding domain-containing protein n=1 Tax=Halocaridina rubra TaxID=373956 RepID=A0AAN9A3U2_HALRR
MLLSLIGLLGLVITCQCMVIAPYQVSVGQCPNITEKYDFDASQYLGRWFELEKIQYVGEDDVECANAVYSDMGDGYIEVYNTGRFPTGEFTDIRGRAHEIAPGVLLVEFLKNSPNELHILDTDYENFSSVYNCVQLGELHWQYAWLLSRTMVMDEEIYSRARLAFINNNVNVSLLETTYQGDDCPYPVQIVL